MFQELLGKIGRALDAHDIAYMVIGGQAVLVYGEPRLTKDIDVTVAKVPEEVEEVIEAVHEMGLEILVDDADGFVSQTYVLPTHEPSSGIRVDFIFSSSDYERQAIRRARSVRIGKAFVRVAAPEDVVIHKIVAGRSRDIEDTKGVLLKNPDVDTDYIRRWLGRFEQALSQPFRRRFEEVLKQTQKRKENLEGG